MIELADKIFEWLLVPSNIVLIIVVIAAFPYIACFIADIIYNNDLDIENEDDQY